MSVLDLTLPGMERDCTVVVAPGRYDRPRDLLDKSTQRHMTAAAQVVRTETAGRRRTYRGWGLQSASDCDILTDQSTWPRVVCATVRYDRAWRMESGAPGRHLATPVEVSKHAHIYGAYLITASVHLPSAVEAELVAIWALKGRARRRAIRRAPSRVRAWLTHLRQVRRKLNALRRAWSRRGHVVCQILGDFNVDFARQAVRDFFDRAFPRWDACWAPPVNGRGTHGPRHIDAGLIRGGQWTGRPTLTDDPSSDHRHTTLQWRPTLKERKR